MQNRLLGLEMLIQILIRNKYSDNEASKSVSTGSSGNVVPWQNVYIDINGAKAPNKFGEDVFVFNRVAGKGNNARQLCCTNHCSWVED